MDLKQSETQRKKEALIIDGYLFVFQRSNCNWSIASSCDDDDDDDDDDDA